MKKQKNGKAGTDKNSTTALVFERFYKRVPGAARVLAGRMLLAVVLSFLCINYVFSQYTMPANTLQLSFIAAGVSAALSLLFSVMQKRYAIPLIGIAGVIPILVDHKAFWAKLSYFIDAVLLECDGSIITSADHTIHPLSSIQRNGAYTYPFINGIQFGSVILCIIFALITTAGLIGNPRIMPSVVTFIVLWTPCLAGEHMIFGWQLIPIFALYAGVIAIGTYYRDGLPIRRVYIMGGYRRKLAMDDRRFNAAVKSQPAVHRAASRGIRYSKYFSSVMSAAAMFAVLGIVLNIVFADSTGIDYEPFFEKLQGINIGKSDDPFIDGPEADYFTSSMSSVFKKNNRLNLTAPSNSTKEIIRVTKSIRSKPLYLRGDIGVDFDGVSWSSNVASEPAEWRTLKNSWLPVEMHNYYYILENSTDPTTAVEFVDASVEYLCDTDTVFAPAYDEYLTVFSRVSRKDKFDLFGDFAARLKSEKSVGERLNFGAFVPLYTDPADNSDIDCFVTACEMFEKYIVTDEFVLTALILDRLNSLNIIPSGRVSYDNYKRYVEEHYLGVPEKLDAELKEYIKSSGLDELRESEYEKYSYTFQSIRPGDRCETIIDRYLSAKAVSDYLKDNYVYSRDARINRRDPVMSFLNNTKSGHCALYASAMTLILREWGIPARYCTGFAANAGMTVQTLRSKDLHAWCEVYLDELGWVTFDPTAASALGNGGGSGNSGSGEASGNSGDGSGMGDASGGQSGTASISESSEATQSSTPNSETHLSSEDSQSDIVLPGGNSGGSGGSGGGSGEMKKFLPYLLMIFGIMAAAALIVLVVRAYIGFKKRAFKCVQSFHRETNSEYVYEKLLAVLRLCKLIPQSGEQPHEFFERAGATLGCDIESSYSILEGLAFGETELDASERAMLGRVFEQVYKAAENKFKLIGKLKLRRLVLSQRTSRP